MANARTMTGYVLLSPDNEPLHFALDEADAIQDFFDNHYAPPKDEPRLVGDWPAMIAVYHEVIKRAGYRVARGSCRIGWRA